MNKWINNVHSLTIEKEKGDRPIGSGKKMWKKKVVMDTGGKVQFVLFRKRIPRKFYLTFGSEQEISVVLSWLE